MQNRNGLFVVFIFYIYNKKIKMNIIRNSAGNVIFDRGDGDKQRIPNSWLLGMDLANLPDRLWVSPDASREGAVYIVLSELENTILESEETPFDGNASELYDLLVGSFFLNATRSGGIIWKDTNIWDDSQIWKD